MAKVISVSNQKGGVGKTTTTCSVAAGLKKRGFRVLAIDLDPQGNLGFSVGADTETSATIYDVLKGDVKLQYAIQRMPAMDVIISSILLSGIELEFTSTGREYLLKNALKPVQDMYDYILLDTPPALGILTINAFTASDTVVVPMLPDIFSLQGIAQLYETVERVRNYCNPRLSIAGILLTRFNPRTLLGREVRGTAELIAKDLHHPRVSKPISAAVSPREKRSPCRRACSIMPRTAPSPATTINLSTNCSQRRRDGALARTKREIDKELMYKKLMPSARAARETEQAEQQAIGGETVTPVVPSAPAVQTVPPPPPASAQKPSEPRRLAIPALDSRQMVVVNTMESYVLGKLDEVLERFSCCRCDRCKKDIVALALNKLPPKYMVLAEGQPEPDIDPQTNAQIVAAMIQAVIKVRAHPRH